MKHFPPAFIAALGLALLAACSTPSGGNATVDRSNNTSNIPSRRPLPEKAKLVELERGAFDAWKNKDANYFESFLADNFLMMTPSGPQDKSAALKEISEHNCEVANYSFSDEAMTVAGGDGAILTLKAAVDVSCGGRKLPSPVWLATVYVRDGDGWKAAYHSETPVMEAADPESPPPPLAAATEEKPADSLTRSLLAVENKGWEAWKNRDAKGLNEVTLSDLVYIDARGAGRYNRDVAIKSWTDPGCNVRSFTLSNAQARPISSNLAILTYKGTAHGTCGGQPLLPVWGTSVFIEGGGFWKALMIMQRPA